MAGVHERAALVAAEQLAQSCLEVLGAAVRSAILHGSLTMDDFVPGRSDIDLLIVVDRALSAAETDALRTTVCGADLGTSSGIDLHVVSGEVAASPTRTPRMALHLGRYPGSTLEVETDVAAAPDLLAELSTARAHGRRLLGAEPRDIVGVVPPAWIRERGEHWLATWKSLTDDSKHAGHMVLTTCRIWRYALEETHSAKTHAARWALARDASLTAVSQAVHQRTIDPGAPIDETGVRRLLEAVADEIRGSR